MMFGEYVTIAEIIVVVFISAFFIAFETVFSLFKMTAYYQLRKIYAARMVVAIQPSQRKRDFEFTVKNSFRNRQTTFSSFRYDPAYLFYLLKTCPETFPKSPHNMEASINEQMAFP